MKSFFKYSQWFTFCFLVLFSCGSSRKSKVENLKSKDIVVERTNQNPIIELKILTGADNYTIYLPLLRDKKIGIVTNQTGILSDKTHLVDFLIEKKINLTKIFAPEHGFRGTADAGEHVIDGKDSKLVCQLYLFMATTRNLNLNN